MTVTAEQILAAIPPEGTEISAPDVREVLLGLLAMIEGSGGGASAASGVSFTPAGQISATDVQGAIEELDSEKLAAAEKGAPSGVATLGPDGKLTAAQVPDDLGGGDDPAALTADDVEAAGAASAYTPSAATVAGHLEGIDAALSEKVSTGDPALADARDLSAGSTVPHHRPTSQTKDGAYTLASTDLGTTITWTAAATCTIPGHGTLGDGYVNIVNDSSGNVVLDGPGATNLTLAAGEVGTVFSLAGKIRACKGTSTVLS